MVAGWHVEFAESQSRHHIRNLSRGTSAPAFGRGKRTKVEVVVVVGQYAGTRVFISLHTSGLPSPQA